MIYFQPHLVDAPDCTAYFEAFDGDDSLGKCFLRVCGATAEVFRLELTGGAEVGEGLLRAAYNFAANRGAYWGVCSAEHADAVTARLRFETQDGVLCGDIPTLLTGTCGGFDKS